MDQKDIAFFKANGHRAWEERYLPLPSYFLLCCCCCCFFFTILNTISYEPYHIILRYEPFEMTWVSIEEYDRNVIQNGRHLSYYRKFSVSYTSFHSRHTAVHEMTKFPPETGKEIQKKIWKIILISVIGSWIYIYQSPRFSDINAFRE